MDNFTELLLHIGFWLAWDITQESVFPVARLADPSSIVVYPINYCTIGIRLLKKDIHACSSPRELQRFWLSINHWVLAKLANGDVSYIDPQRSFYSGLPVIMIDTVFDEGACYNITLIALSSRNPQGYLKHAKKKLGL